MHTNSNTLETSDQSLTPTDILHRVLALVSDPERWTVQAFARTDAGASCREDDRRADSWAIDGAIHREVMLATRCAYDEVRTHPLTLGAKRLLNEVIGLQSICTWQDGTSHPAVIAALEAAVSR